MNISRDDIVSHGALSPEHSDTLHVQWTLLSSCNYQCAYCYQPKVAENCIFVKERIMSMAHSLLELPRPSYVFTFTGGEPTLHPHLPEILSYICTSGRKVFVNIETNGSQDIAYFQQLMCNVPDHTLQFQISVHLAYAELAHILTLAATIAEARQLAHIQLMFDPAEREAAHNVHAALVSLRGIIPFTSSIELLMTPADPSQVDPRYTEADVQWQQEAEASFSAAAAAGPVAGPALPRAESHFLCKQGDNMLMLNHAAVQPNTLFENFYCCLGSNLVRVDADGRYYGALCDMVPNHPPLWRVEADAIAQLPSIARCRNAHCPGGLNAILPKFRKEEDAQNHLKAMQERGLTHAWEAAPLRNPIKAELRTEDIVRARLKRMKLLRETVTRIDPSTTAVVTFGDVLEEAVQHYTNQQPPLPHLPAFVLADWDGAAHAAWEEVAHKHGVSITPMKDRGELAQKVFCLYARPNYNLWGKTGLHNLSLQCLKFGLCEAFIDHVVTLPLQWKRKPNISFVVQRFADICTVYNALADEISREIFLAAMKSIETGDAGYLPISDFAQYNHPKVKAELGDVVLEGGVEWGTTTREFSQQVGATGQVIGFEPLQKAYNNSLNTTKQCKNVLIEHLGLWSGASTFYIEDNAGASRMVTKPNARTEECHAIDIDSYLVQHKNICSLIKLDIEGAEVECLKGAARTIKQFMPKLHISLYHAFEHYLEIPLWILENFSGYRLYMGHHTLWYGETCLYALPPVVPAKRPLPLPASVHIPLVSIIVPTHNNEATLRRCIDSALIQGVDDMEIIIIDDASTDKTPEIIAEYVRRFPKMVRTMRFTKNKGPGPARNAGMHMAMGQYTAFIDSDDMLAENFLQRGLEVMAAEQADIVAFDMVINRHGKKEEELWGVEPGTWAGEDSLRQLLLKKAGGYGTYCRLYRADLLRKYNILYGDMKVHEDIYFCVQAFYYSQKTVVIPDVGYYRYIREGSTSVSAHGDNDFNAFVYFVEFLTDFFENNGLSIESEMYTYCIRRIYHQDKDRVFAAVLQADKENRLEALLTQEKLLALGKSKEALCCILADYAMLYCHQNDLHPKVAPKDLDWQAAAAAPRPPKTYTAYGHAENPLTPAPLLSVIVPNYNKEQYLKTCLDSIFSQSMQDFEVIIVDDASTDGSYSVLMDYADIYQSVRLYQMDYNVRQGVCRNIGIHKARGEYILFVDSDDKCLPEYFLLAVQNIRQEHADVVVFAARHSDAQQNTIWNDILVSSTLTGNAAAQQYLKGKFEPAPWAKIFNTKFLLQNGILFPDHVYHQDQQFFFSVLIHAKKVVTQSILVYKNVQTQNSTIRPSTRTYLHLHSAICFYDNLQNNAEYVFSKKKIYSEVGLCHTLWNIENVLLQTCNAFYAVTKSIPITLEDHNLLKRSTLFIRSLLIGFTQCRSRSVMPREFLPSFSQCSTLKYTPQAHTEPLISVIIPTYNQEECIARCLDSVLSQSLRNLEVIIINDASTDKTLAICEAYALKDLRVRVFSNEQNMGQGHSRNWALELSRGKYITFVDSDDVILENFLLRGVSFLEAASDLDIVHFSYEKVSAQGEILQKISCVPKVISGYEAALQYIKGEHNAWIVPSKILRKEYLVKNKVISSSIIHEDEVFLLSAFYYAKKASFVDECAYHYIQTPHSASAMNSVKATTKHIDGCFTSAALREQLINQYFPDIDAEKSLKKKHANFLERIWKKYAAYIASYAYSNISILSDKNVVDLKNAPAFFCALLNDYAKLYVQHAGYKPALPPEDLEPSYVRPEPATYLIPIPFHAESEKKIQLSVIIPAFNVARYLSRCINSVLDQQTPDIEIILVEDCSVSDDTLTICKEYAQKYSCIRLFCTPWNSGLGTVRNLAMQQARGKYITFVDSDDWLAQSFIYKGLKICNDNPLCDVIDFNWCAWDDIKNEQMYYKRMPNEVCVDSVTALKTYIKGTHANYGAWSKMYNANFIRKNSILFGTLYNEDESFLLQVYSKVSTAMFSDILSYYYVRNSAQSTIMRPALRGKKYFESTLYNLQSVHNFFHSLQNISEYASMREQRMASYSKGHHRDSLLQYIYTCMLLGLPSPLTNEVLDTLTLSKEFMRALVTDYAVLSQKKPQANG